MTAAEKRKYVSAKLLELLAPYGYLGRNNAVWKYSLDGKYVVCISCDIARCGSLNEIEIKFGSFFAPIQKSSASAKMLFLGNLLPLAFYIRNAGLGRPLLSSYLPFEEQVDEILPFFKSIVFPLLPQEGDLSDYLCKAEQLLKLHTESCLGIPQGVEIEEMVFAYLSLERQEDALRIVSQYVEQCRYAVSYINNHAEMFEYDFRERICYWEKKCREAVMLKKVIQTDGGREFELEIRKREKDSDELCRQFFHLF